MAPKRSTKKAAALAQAQRKQSLAAKPKLAKSASATSVSSGGGGARGAAADDPITLDDAPAAGPAVLDDGAGNAPREPREPLDPKDRRWRALYAEAEMEMGGMSPNTHNVIHHILRVFDMTAKYGPSVGRTRLERWERARKLGLNPPDEIRAILVTKEAEADASYRENVLYHYGI